MKMEKCASNPPQKPGVAILTPLKADCNSAANKYGLIFHKTAAHRPLLSFSLTGGVVIRQYRAPDDFYLQ
jgi:hypothetical protein